MSDKEIATHNIFITYLNLSESFLMIRILKNEYISNTAMHHTRDFSKRWEYFKAFLFTSSFQDVIPSQPNNSFRNPYFLVPDVVYKYIDAKHMHHKISIIFTLQLAFPDKISCLIVSINHSTPYYLHMNDSYVFFQECYLHDSLLYKTIKIIENDIP